MFHRIQTVAHWGIKPETSAKQANLFRLTNILLLLFFFANLILLAIFCFFGNRELLLIEIPAPFFFAGALWLMQLGYTTLTRILVFVVGCIASLILITTLGSQTNLQLILVFASAFSMIFFSTDKKWPLAIAMFVPIFSFIGLEVTGYPGMFGLTRVELSSGQALLLRLTSTLLIWAMMLSHFIYFVRDRRKSEAQRVLSAKMVAIGRMAAAVAHEVNNPLQIIVSYTERLKNIIAKDPANREAILNVASQIESVAMRMASINKGLLALSRDGTGEPMRDLSMSSVIKAALDLCRNHLEINNIYFKIGDVVPALAVTGVETQLVQVVTNLLNNAIDAALECPKRWIEIAVTASDAWIEFAVTDCGAGVDPKLRRNIFDPFFTTKPVGKGTGLGLSISHGIMLAHGGSLFLDEKSAHCRFVGRLPRAQDLV